MSETYEIRRRVTFNDTNAAGNVYYATFILWQGACREQWAMEYAPVFTGRLHEELTAVTASCSMEYARELHLADHVAIRMTIPTAHLNLITLNFEFFRLDADREQFAGRGAQTISCARRVGDDLEPAAWPREMVSGLDRFGVDTGRVFSE
ncbi:acyl-CoA thioesterase [Actinosynnema sp. NPDC059797]